jgi:hypothetical protein
MAPAEMVGPGSETGSPVSCIATPAPFATPAGDSQPFGPLTTPRLEIALRRRNTIEAFRARKAAGDSNPKAAKAAGYAHSTIYNWSRQYDGTLESLMPRTHRSGRKRRLALLPAETRAVRANKLLNNRDRDSGSTPQAIRQTIKEGALRPEVAAAFAERDRTGLPMATPALANDLHISPATTRAFRHPRNAWLDFAESPGSLHLTRDERTGETRQIEPGEQCTIDDGTKNFICTVPMQRPGDKCWQNFGVIVGRWQILLVVDHRSYFIQAFCHTARPKSSYRAEDMQAAFHIAFTEHGCPRKVMLEKGISKSDLLHHTLDLLGVKYEHVNSPHQKVVEFVFNALWGRLSFLPGQVGRTRGEEAQVDALVESCRRGASDPRQFFLPLSTVLKALKEVVDEWNAHLVKSDQYGNWVPADWFRSAAPRAVRLLQENERWIFSPTVSAPLLVRGMNVRTSYLVMPGYSWQFDFSAPWFCEFYGARVRFHYNAFAPECEATVVLAEDFHGTAAGTVLGPAEQMNWQTRVSRRLMGIEETEDIGLLRARMNAQALQRSALAIRPDGKPGVEFHEARDGAGRLASLETGGSPRLVTSAPAAAPRRNFLKAPTPDEFARKRERLAASAARSRELTEAST